MSLYVTSINGMGSGEDSLGGALQNLAGMDQADHMHIASDFINQAGVVSIPDTDFEVTEDSPASNDVIVAPGTCYVLNDLYVKNGSLLHYWRVESDADAAVTIAANASGNPRIDIICVKVDTAVSPDDNASNVASVVVVQGTPAASPSVPATPANHLKLAEIAVANGFTTITNSEITDTRVDVGFNINGGLYAQDSAGAQRSLIGLDDSDLIQVGNGVNEVAINKLSNMRAHLSADQSIPTATFTKIQLDTEDWDIGGDFDNATNYRFTAPITGYYRVNAGLRFTDLNAANNAFVAIYRSGVAYAFQSSPVHANGEDPRMVVSALVFLTAATDYIELFAQHNFGSNRNVTGGSSETWMDIILDSV